MTKSLSLGRRSVVISTGAHSASKPVGYIRTRGGGVTMRFAMFARRLSVVLITRSA